MALSLRFIEVSGPDKDKTQTRRTIRSQAARAGYAADSHKTRELPVLPNHTKPGMVRLIVLGHTKSRQTGRLQHEERKKTNDFQDDPHIGQTLVRFSGNDRAIPATSCSICSLQFLPLVITNYLTHLAVAIPELDGPYDDCLLRKAWFPMVLHSPVLFQIVALFSASHYAACQSDALYASDLLFMKQCALAGLQQTLSRNGAVNRDENIAAAAKMASYEAVYGSEDVYHIHMNAVEDMLRRRGGLSSMGMNGFLARLLIFVDTNSAFLLNTRLHLTGSALPRKEPFIPPNPGRFLGVS